MKAKVSNRGGKVGEKQEKAGAAPAGKNVFAFAAPAATPRPIVRSAPAGAHAPVAVRVPPAAAKKTPAAKKAAAKRGPVRIFQIFYDDWHEKMLDADFEAYDNRGEDSELHEFAVFEKLAKSGRVNGAKYWGALSWRFREKTGMSGKQWLEVMAANPGFEVYYCNPFPLNEALYHNSWLQGEPSHPSFLALSRAFLEAAGLPLDCLSSIQPSPAFAAANYFVASPAFWEKYLRFVRNTLGNAERKLPPKLRAQLHSKQADPQGFHFGATYVPFIVERLLSLFLATEGAEFKAFKVPLPQCEKEMNAHLRLLREMKDVAHRTKSNWLAVCWVNYRNLYLHHTFGQEWCAKYLRSVTPGEVKFA